MYSYLFHFPELSVKTLHKSLVNLHDYRQKNLTDNIIIIFIIFDQPSCLFIIFSNNYIIAKFYILINILANKKDSFTNRSLLTGSNYLSFNSSSTISLNLSNSSVVTSLPAFKYRYSVTLSQLPARGPEGTSINLPY